MNSWFFDVTNMLYGVWQNQIYYTNLTVQAVCPWFISDTQKIPLLIFSKDFTTMLLQNIFLDSHSWINSFKIWQNGLLVLTEIDGYLVEIYLGFGINLRSRLMHNGWFAWFESNKCQIRILDFENFFWLKYSWTCVLSYGISYIYLKSFWLTQ